MREIFLEYLTDPITNGSLQMTILEKSNDHVISGLLTSDTHWYPIVNGIPRMLIGQLKEHCLQTHQTFFDKHREALPQYVCREWQAALESIPDRDIFLKHQKKTAESFSYEWKYIYKENTYEEKNFFHFLSPFLEAKDLHNKKTLDIGCGSGRFTKWAALSGTEVAFGSDLGESVEVAYAMTQDLPNACIVQSDIYAMPFRGVFDIAYSIGVLHHLPRPKQGFSKLPHVLKKGGKMLIWVYSRRNNARALYFYEPLRELLKKLPKPLLFKLCIIPGGIVHGINQTAILLRKIGFVQLAKRFPFAYYANFPFNMKLNDAFDVLATPKSNYYFSEHIQEWFRDAALQEVATFEHPEAGITCIGTK